MRAQPSDGEVAVEPARRWATELAESGEWSRQLFPRAEPRNRAMAYRHGVLSPVERNKG